MIYTVNKITNFPITCERGNSYRTRLPQRVADSCYVLQSLIFMMLGHMGEAHRAVHDIVRLRYQHMNVTILYSKG